MNVYDFDGTIYDGDSSIDFFKFCFKRNKKIILTFPALLFSLILYLLKIKEKEYFKSSFFRFVTQFDNIDSLVDEFWEKNDYKIKSFYRKNHKDSDIIISASPYFLLDCVAKKYKFKLIATDIDKKTGQLVSKNCYGTEKIKRLNELGIFKINEFYSDSLSDNCLALIAKKPFMVKKDLIINWNDYRVPFIKRLKKQFLNRDFFVFLVIGGINVFNGIFISLLYSFVIKNAIVAYIFGFLTSMTIAYLLNTFLNFKVKLSLKIFLNFVINNIPNFCIQIFSVIVLINILSWKKFIAYAISSIIAVPITFLLVKYKVFKKGDKNE